MTPGPAGPTHRTDTSTACLRPAGEASARDFLAARNRRFEDTRATRLDLIDGLGGLTVARAAQRDPIRAQVRTPLPDDEEVPGGRPAHHLALHLAARERTMHEVTIVPAHRPGAVEGKGPEQIVLLENLLDRRRLRRGSGEQSRCNKQGAARTSRACPPAAEETQRPRRDPKRRPDRATH